MKPQTPPQNPTPRKISIDQAANDPEIQRTMTILAKRLGYKHKLDADEIIQETWVRLVRNWDKNDGRNNVGYVVHTMKHFVVGEMVKQRNRKRVYDAKYRVFSNSDSIHAAFGSNDEKTRHTRHTTFQPNPFHNPLHRDHTHNPNGEMVTYLALIDAVVAGCDGDRTAVYLWLEQDVLGITQRELAVRYQLGNPENSSTYKKTIHEKVKKVREYVAANKETLWNAFLGENSTTEFPHVIQKAA